MAKQWEGREASRQHGSPPAYAPGIDGQFETVFIFRIHVVIYLLRCKKIIFKQEY